MEPNILFYDITHGRAKPIWEHAYKSLMLSCELGDLSVPSHFIIEYDRDGNQFFEEYYNAVDDLYEKQTEIKAWPHTVEICDSVTMQLFEDPQFQMGKNDPIYGLLWKYYTGKRKITLSRNEQNIMSYLKFMFSTQDETLLKQRAFDFIVRPRYTLLPELVFQKVLELGASEEEYYRLVEVMCDVIVTDILHGKNDGRNTKHGSALFVEMYMTLPFSLIRGIWNIHAARTAYNITQSGKNVILILGRMHNYAIRKMIDAVYVSDDLDEEIECKTYQESSNCPIM